MATYASVADVTARWDGTGTEARIQAAIDDAHVILNRRVQTVTGSTLDEWVAGGNVDSDMVRLVLIRAVTRNLDNPKGFLAEHAGEYGYSYGSTKTAAAAAKVGFTEDDLADLGIVIAPIGTITVGTPWNSCSPYPSEEAALRAARSPLWWY